MRNVEGWNACAGHKLKASMAAIAVVPRRGAAAVVDCELVLVDELFAIAIADVVCSASGH